jgi:hypothetical protein
MQKEVLSGAKAFFDLMYQSYPFRFDLPSTLSASDYEDVKAAIEKAVGEYQQSLQEHGRRLA